MQGSTQNLFHWLLDLTWFSKSVHSLTLRIKMVSFRFFRYLRALKFPMGIKCFLKACFFVVVDILGSSFLLKGSHCVPMEPFLKGKPSDAGFYIGL